MTRKVRPTLHRTSRCCSRSARPARRAISFRSSMAPVDATDALGASKCVTKLKTSRSERSGAIRHFTRLSTWNYAIDLGLYPLARAP